MENFDDLMSETLEDTLRMVLGENVTNLIHSFTKKQATLKQKEIGNNIDDTIAYLERLLGKEGA